MGILITHKVNTASLIYLCIYLFIHFLLFVKDLYQPTIETQRVDVLMLLSAACTARFQLRERSGNKTNYPVYIASVITARWEVAC